MQTDFESVSSCSKEEKYLKTVVTLGNSVQTLRVAVTIQTRKNT